VTTVVVVVGGCVVAVVLEVVVVGAVVVVCGVVVVVVGSLPEHAAATSAPVSISVAVLFIAYLAVAGARVWAMRLPIRDWECR
jgi:hypothetical protein